MSYILNALKKSEQERRQRQESPLQQDIQFSEDIQPKKRTGWIIGLLLAINLGAMGYLLNKEAPLVQEIQQDKPSIAPHGASADKPELAEQAVTPVTSGQKHPENSTSSLVAQTKPTPKTITELKKNHDVDKNMPQTAKTAANRPVKKNRTAAAQLADQAVQPNAPPWLNELPIAFRRNVPTVKINVYVYAEQEADRFIMIDMRKYQTDQEITDGMILKAIQPDGIVVQYRNKTFKIRRD